MLQISAELDQVNKVMLIEVLVDFSLSSVSASNCHTIDSAARDSNCLIEKITRRLQCSACHVDVTVSHCPEVFRPTSSRRYSQDIAEILSRKSEEKYLV